MARKLRQSTFKFQEFSLKQKKILTWWIEGTPVCDKYGIIADGAIRSGKTISMSLSFIMWGMESFNEGNFAMCGKTIGSFRRNVLMPLKQMLNSLGYKYSDHRTDNLLEIRKNGKTNYFYIFGGRDERSQDLIQGITLAGIFFDEVALMPESFVNQGTARCSVEGSKMWFNCNPDMPQHWFNQRWILEREKQNILYLHFTMDDNLSLSESKKTEYRGRYNGVFYKRYILGQWANADGAIYPQFAEEPDKYKIRFSSEEERAAFARNQMFISIGIDFGGNRSKTTFIATAVEKGFRSITVVADYAMKGRKGEINPDKLNKEFIEFYTNVKAQYPEIAIRYIFADSEAQYLINGLRVAAKNARINTPVSDCAKNPIVDRIACANALLNTDRCYMHESCKLLSDGIETAVWDPKAAEKGKDERLDDFTSDIDILDAWEYSWERFMKKLLPDMKRKGTM